MDLLQIWAMRKLHNEGDMENLLTYLIVLKAVHEVVLTKKTRNQPRFWADAGVQKLSIL